MARERFVTRSIAVTTYDVMCVEMSSKNVVNHTVDIPSACNLKDAQIDTIIKALLPSDTVMVMKTATETKEVLYGMPEADFIKLAKVLPPRTKQDESEE